jgi:hypothetical protein
MLVIRQIFFALILLVSNGICQESLQETENELVNSLLTNYKNTIRPSSLVKGGYVVYLKQIFSLSHKEKQMVSSMDVYAHWEDQRLKWIPQSFSNVDKVLIQTKKIWKPDFMIENSEDSDSFFKYSDFHMALVNHTGHVNIVYRAQNVKTICNQIDVHKFPFDSQT